MMNDNDIGITLSADDKALLSVLRGAGSDIQAFAKQGGNSLRELQDAARGNATAIEKLAGGVLERVAWEVVPDLAEALIKEEIRKIKDAAA